MITIDIKVIRTLADGEKFRDLLGAGIDSRGILGVDANTFRDVIAFMGELEDVVLGENPDLLGTDVFGLLVAGKRKVPFGPANYEFPNIVIVDSAA
ncbi:hypothetical protein [Nocardia tengchongensis]|uniref:hypothetical protein n=1 Tax=Nocardia tengchongensis TaxID=2055889 RepID=UPI00365B757E